MWWNPDKVGGGGGGGWWEEPLIEECCTRMMRRWEWARFEEEAAAATKVEMYDFMMPKRRILPHDGPSSASLYLAEENGVVWGRCCCCCLFSFHQLILWTINKDENQTGKYLVAHPLYVHTFPGSQVGSECQKIESDPEFFRGAKDVWRVWFMVIFRISIRPQVPGPAAQILFIPEQLCFATWREWKR